ncbi:MAG: helix-turn-helix domain-containing protein [Candidatus Izemoplasmatales bacterium]
MTSKSIPRYQTSNKAFYYENVKNTNSDVGAHRLEQYAICYLAEGKLKIETNLIMQEATAPALFVIAPDVIRKFIDTNQEVNMKVLFFNKEFFLQNQIDVTFLSQYDFFEQKDRHIIPLTNKQSVKMEKYYQLIEEQIVEDSINTGEIIRSWIYILLNEIDEIVKSSLPKIKRILTRNEQLVLDFKLLSSAHFKEHKELSFYAEKLHLSKKYLSQVIKEETGMSASEWIKELVFLEAKVLLKDSKLSIAEISDYLKFSDQSHFGKFFKVRSGSNPLHYKNS